MVGIFFQLTGGSFVLFLSHCYSVTSVYFLLFIVLVKKLLLKKKKETKETKLTIIKLTKTSVFHTMKNDPKVGGKICLTGRVKISN